MGSSQQQPRGEGKRLSENFHARYRAQHRKHVLPMALRLFTDGKTSKPPFFFPQRARGSLRLPTAIASPQLPMQGPPFLSSSVPTLSGQHPRSTQIPLPSCQMQLSLPDKAAGGDGGRFVTPGLVPIRQAGRYGVSCQTSTKSRDGITAPSVGN